MHFPGPGKQPQIANVSVVLLDVCRSHLEDFAVTLPADELAQAGHYRSREDSERYIIARALIRLLCADQLGIVPRAVGLLRTPGGKPYVTPADSKQKIEFNVSHSGNCVMIAWSKSGPVGVDVEAAKPTLYASLREMATTAFSPAEFAVWRAVKNEDALATFYRIWVRKEAILKANGIGIGRHLHSFSVVTQTTQGVKWLDQIRFPAAGRTWRLSDLNPATDHQASIAVPVGTEVEECPFPGLPQGEE